ncbi:hypothetical protein HELRODRAFT_186146 [Helobdella robusta]|uniref:Acyltransferase n=1 Tax=Helobdella robusta TaxID=6412 RepID=T1FNQ5_HELRO|nr:hypothetical protein HELRODRAFT_186146 [Helobdella robusta]ESN92321.1 hypothetical protein HELRODRAFT_186146 [Helobdella robusta]
MAERKFGIKFANILTTPLERRLQTLAALQWAYTFYFMGLTGLALFLFLLFSSYYYIALLYSVWIIYDINACQMGGREIQCLKTCRVWGYFRDYFPIKLHKSTDLEADHNYLFLYHPHGIASCAAFSCFATDGPGASKLFPELRFRLLTLRCNFFLPFAREYISFYGICAASKECIHHLLTNCGTNNALVLVVGGAREALEANPGNFNLVLSKRKGFVKLALQHGTPLVPVYAFGESDIYTQVALPPDSKLRKMQNTFMKILSFSPPIFHGRGIFNYTFGLLPYRRPINVAVGKPLKLPKIVNPNDDEINEWHRKYVDRLVDHFEKHKLQFGLKEDDHLNIL